MAAKYYAIKKGENLRTGESVNNIIVTSWNECLAYVKGVKGAVYKSFLSETEAKAYLSSGNALKKGEDKYPENIPHIYVDGSYNIATERFGYGVAVILKDEVIYADFGGGQDKECNQRQVNGELKAAVEGVKHSIEMGYDHVVLFYDYAGVCNHAVGSWERNNDLSAKYYELMQGFMQEGKIKITFVKVDSHTDDLFNDIADELAKLGAEVSFTSVVDKAIGTATIKVSNAEVKKILGKIVKKNINNVLCEDDAAIDFLSEEAENCKDESIDEIEEAIGRIKKLKDKEKAKFVKSLKKDIQTQIILKLI